MEKRQAFMATTVGHDVRSSEKVNSLIDKAVQEFLAASEQFTEVRGPDPQLEKAASEKIQRIGAVRGRPLFYNYLGSGVGRGPYVELEDGSVKLDLINGIGVHVLGHGHPRVL